MGLIGKIELQKELLLDKGWTPLVIVYVKGLGLEIRV